MLLCGCPVGLPNGTPMQDTGNDPSTEPTDGADGESSGEPDNGTGPGSMILVQTIEGAASTEYDIYKQVSDESVQTYTASNELVSLPPGVYYLTEYFNADFVYASDVVVSLGNTTTVTLGGIKLATVPGASDGSYDIYDASGETVYSTYTEPNIVITAPAGHFTLKEYFNGDFAYATDVEVTAGETTDVEMGGVTLITVPGASDGTYAIYDSTGGTVYATYNEPNVVITAPAGTFTLKEYFNDDFTYATGIEVRAGEVTSVPMGAIRYSGVLDYDIYADGQLLSSYNERDLIITAPPGTYMLTEYFDDENVLATIVVVAGAVTNVP